MKKLILILMLGLLVSCMSNIPFNVPGVGRTEDTPEDVKYPHEIMSIHNDYELSYEKFVAKINDYVQFNSWWKGKVVIEIQFRKKQRLSGDDWVAYIFWRHKTKKEKRKHL